MRQGALLIIAAIILRVAVVAYADTSSVSVSIVTPACSDTLDNDSDTLVDYPADPGCSSLTDLDETDSVVTPTPECGDDLDNDSDGKTDYPADLGCDSTTDTSESGEISVGGGGPISGGGGATVITVTQVIFEGTAFVGAKIVVLADGVFAGSTKTKNDDSFVLTIPEISHGTYIFNIYAVDLSGRSTRPFSYALQITKNTLTYITGIKFSQIEEGTVGVCPPRADLNQDCKVDLVDFSIAAFWWDRSLEGEFKQIEDKFLSGDGEISLEDFSILAYYWTG